MTTRQRSAPDYYVLPNGIEVGSVVEHLNAFPAQAVQYILRAGRKPDVSEIDDLMKAIDFLWLRIAYLERQSK